MAAIFDVMCEGRAVSETSIEMNDLMFAALDHAVASIEESGPLVPFTMTLTKVGEKKLTRFALDLLEQGLEAARTHVRLEKVNIQAYAIAWDGFVTIDGKKWDCVLVEAGEQSNDQGVLLAQRYEKRGFFRKKNIPVGNPALIEHPVSRLHT